MTTTRAVWLTAPEPPLDALVCQALLSRCFSRVVCVYAEGQAPRAQHLERVQCVQVDFKSYRRLRDLLSSRELHDVDTLVHVVPDDGDSVAADATHQLLQLAEEQPVIQRFVLRSSARLYRLDSREPALIDEDHALDWARGPHSSRACAQADFTVCERMGSSRLQLCVLRCAEVLSPSMHGALHAYLSSRMCLRPLGYDPMLNVLSVVDLAHALSLAADSRATGIFNIPGLDTLPLSELIHAAQRVAVPVPGPLIGPMYALRARVPRLARLGMDGFDYESDRTRLHYGAVVDGSKARRLLGYQPSSGLHFAQLFASDPPKSGNLAPARGVRARLFR